MNASVCPDCEFGNCASTIPVGSAYDDFNRIVGVNVTNNSHQVENCTGCLAVSRSWHTSWSAITAGLDIEAEIPVKIEGRMCEKKVEDRLRVPLGIAHLSEAYLASATGAR